MFWRMITIFAVLLVAASAEGKDRTWTSADGRTMNAEFVGELDGDVTFRKDGKLVVIRLEKLSEKDQQVVKDLAAGKQPEDASSAAPAEAEKPAANERDSGKSKKPVKIQVRTWTDRFGVRGSGKFVRVDGNDVVLSRGSRVHTIPFANLSDGDQEYVREILISQGKEDEIPSDTPPARQDETGGGGIAAGGGVGGNVGRGVGGGTGRPGMPLGGGVGKMPSAAGMPGGIGPQGGTGMPGRTGGAPGISGGGGVPQEVRPPGGSAPLAGSGPAAGGALRGGAPGTMSGTNIPGPGSGMSGMTPGMGGNGMGGSGVGGSAIGGSGMGGSNSPLPGSSSPGMDPVSIPSPTFSSSTFEQAFSCSSCGARISQSESSLTKCPHCGITWGYQIDQFGNKTTTSAGRNLATVGIVVIIFVLLGVVVFIALFVGIIVAIVKAAASSSTPRPPQPQRYY